MYPNDAAIQANKKLAYQSSQYTTTTVPLMKIDDSLTEIRDVLKDILDVLKGNQENSKDLS